MKINKVHESLSVRDLERFENNHNLTLPIDYRDFLLEYNGGYPEPGIYKISEDLGESIINVFFGIGSMYDNLDKKLDIFDEILEKGFIPIADDPSGDQICIGITKEYFGQVYHWAHDEEYDGMENMYYLSSNFKEFLASLYEG